MSPLPKTAARPTVGRVTPFALVLCAATLLGALASGPWPAEAGAADRHVEGFVGGVVVNSSVGGQSIGASGDVFWVSRDVAVYEGTDADPTTDKVFATSNAKRIQRFDATGAFEQAWGKDTIKAGAPGDTGTGYEVCTVAADCKSGDEGTGAGHFGQFGPSSVAVDNTSGWVYVLDQNNLRVQKFDTDGNFILMFGKDVLSTGGTGTEVCTAAQAAQCKAGAEGAGSGELTSSGLPRLYVHPTTGDVFVANPGNRRVEQFDSQGAFIRAWGYDVIPGGAAEFEVCTATCQAGQGEGSANGQFGSGQPQHVAVDSEGVLYASDSNNAQRIVRFDSDDHATPATALLAPITATDATPAGNLLAGLTRGLEADPATNRLYALRDPDEVAGNARIQELSSNGATVFSTSPPPGDAGQLGSTGDWTTAMNAGLGLQASTGRLFLSTQTVSHENFNPFRFTACPYESDFNRQECAGYFTLDEDGLDPFAASADPVTEKTPFSAVMTGTIEPEGFARYWFEHSDDGGETWTKASVSKPVASNGQVEVSEDVEGLLPNSEYSYRLFVFKIHGLTERAEVLSNEVDFLTDAVPPTATTLAPSSFADTSATLAARIDPQNKQTSYRFEWGTDESYGNVLPVPDGDAGAGFGEVGVLAQLEGLQPNTTYHYRVIADNGTPTDPECDPEAEACATEVVGEDRSFTTRSPFQGFPARAYEQVSPAEKGGESISGPVGEADNGGETGGYAVSLDGEAAAFDGRKGVFADADWIPGPIVGRLIYQSRRNPEGDGWTTKLRTPKPTGSTGIAGIGAKPVSTPFFGGEDDSQLALVGAPLRDHPLLGDGGGYLRSWQGGGLQPLFLNADSAADEGDSPIVGASADMRRVFFESREPRSADPAVPAEATKLYEWVHPAELGAPTGNESQMVRLEVVDGGTFRLIFDGRTTQPIPYDASPELLQERLEVLANVDPGDALVYFSAEFSNSDQHVWRVEFAGAYAGKDVPELEIDGAGLTNSEGFPTHARVFTEPPVRLAGVDPEGEPFQADAILGGPGQSRTAVSDDGRHAFFSTPVTNPLGGGGSSTLPATKVYRRTDGETTTLVSPSRASEPDPQGEKAKRFAAATDDGGRLFFTSAEQLTDDANTGPERKGTDLYRYDVGAEELIDVSASTNDADGAQVRGVLGIDDAGETVYYVAKGRVVAGKGIAGRDNVYRWHDDGSPGGETRYVATLASGEADEVNFGRDETTPARVSPDGEALLIQSVAELTGHPNNGHAQLFLYEAGADGGQGALSCVSCRPDGTPTEGAAGIPRTSMPSESGDALLRALSEDGSQVVFHTDDNLLPADDNGLRDVYAWREGRLELISAAGDWPSGLHGASSSGDDVFFVTREPLVGQDEDLLRDLYDARVGGGIAAQNAPPPGELCRGEECKPEAEDADPAGVPPSGYLPSQGNLSPKLGCKRYAKRVRGLSKRAKRARRAARRLASGGKRGKARAMRRRSQRLGRRAKRVGKQAKRCRAARKRGRAR